MASISNSPQAIGAANTAAVARVAAIAAAVARGRATRRALRGGTADPAGKRFIGSAIWRTETVTPGAGQAPDLAVRCDVKIPERRLAFTMSTRHNNDQALPASHTVEE